MKKTYLILAAAAAFTFTACTSEVDEPQNLGSAAIGFTNHVDKASRAIESDADFTDFFVYGKYTNGEAVVKAFDNVKVTKSSEVWSYSPVQYWVAEAKYLFKAVSADNADPTDVTYDEKDNKLTVANYAVTAENQKDLIYAFSSEYTGKASGNDKVDLKFNHMLARFHFNFNSEFTDGSVITVSNVVLSKLVSTSTLTDGAWGQTTGEVSLTSKYTAAGSTEAAASFTVASKSTTTTDYLYTMPNNYTDASALTLAFDVVVKDVNDKEIGKKSVSATWVPNLEMGKSYVVNVTLNGKNTTDLEPIEFTASCNTWGEDQDAGTIVPAPVQTQQ